MTHTRTLRALRNVALTLAALAFPKFATAQLPITIQHIRPVDERGVDTFEPSKEDTVKFNGAKISLGAAFRQDFQGLGDNNTALPNMVNKVNANQLIAIGHSFNNAVANAYLNVQLAQGIRVAMTGYLSSRHHTDAWVKDGYALIDDSPIDNPLLKAIMSHVTAKVGEFEVNYGDGHFRRTDNGLAMDNPFVGNYILDAFTTEPGAEVYVHDGWWLAMLGMTSGKMDATVLNPAATTPAYLGKLGFDRQLTSDLRVRLMGSTYMQKSSSSQALYGGDRAGSPYFDVLENTTSTESGNAWSGEIVNPLTSKLDAFAFNPFIKYRGAELFSQIETATGNNGPTEATGDRTVRQQVYEGLYRFANDKLYLGGRYIDFSGRLFGLANDVSVNRYQVGGGWFVTPNLLAKAEWVNQTYNNFPLTDIRSGGNFKGFMIEGAVAF